MQLKENQTLLETEFKKEKLPNNGKEIIQWCQKYNSFQLSSIESQLRHMHPESNIDEYIFWIPPFEYYEKYIQTRYPEIPPQIETVLVAAVKRQAEENNGYLLIIFT